MTNDSLRFKYSCFCAVAVAVLSCSPAFPALADVSGAEPNDPSEETPVVAMLHVFVQADLEHVRFEHIWVFNRQNKQGPWQVSIDLPADADLLQVDDPNETRFSLDPPSVSKTMAADSLIDSLGFSYLLSNQNGRCSSRLVPDYAVDSMIVSVSGSNTHLESGVLEFDRFRTERSGYSGVYTARSLPAGQTVRIELSGLPRKASDWPRIVALAGLPLIFLAALITMICGLITMYAGRKTRVAESTAYEAGS
jgi:hypothetical protein